jgi:hypothetical protein
MRHARIGAAWLLVLAAPLAGHAQPAEGVRAIAAPLRRLSPEAESAGLKRFSFIVYGDTRGRRDGQALQYEHSLIVDSVLATIKRRESTESPVAFVLQTGDTVVNGRDPRQWNESFVALINRLTTEGGVPYFLAAGNHDVTSAAALDDPGRRVGLANYLAAIAALIPPDGAARRLAGYPTYAFGYGNAFVLALDSNIAEDDRQYEWIKSQLEGLDRKRYVHVIAFFHHPPFSSGPHGGPKLERQSAALRANYLPLFRAHGVSMTLSGHEHLFEHWVERWQDGDGRRHRMDHVVTGGGGAPLYPYTGEPNLADYLAAAAGEKVSLEHLARPGFERGQNPYHYVVVDVDGGEMRLEVIGVDWGRDYQPYRSNRVGLRDER